MSIVTRTGDDGTTALLFGRRLSKNHPRVRAYGMVDELGAALGLCRAHGTAREWQDLLAAVQQTLVGLMGELAVADEDRERFLASKLQRLSQEDLERLDAAAVELEAVVGPFRGWVFPGATIEGAQCDFARTVCRRCERALVELQENGGLLPELALAYLNRLSDVLWLLGRRADGVAIAPGL
ncbi:MAG: cob(I)yrinic acid a,c-diamide adenosyltransferase [Puniceicoccaceae bacterium]|nr:MAG: cob(I)yrinic acid a,c-diamide adenosyltransferase [Puniceicoccaceae bacterium]